MPVDRLDARLETAWAYRLALVVAPAGSGKTTLLARFAERAGSPVGWYRAEAWDRDEQGFCVTSRLPSPRSWTASRPAGQRADAANALDAWHGPRVLLIVDDLHALEGTAAEAALERLIDYAPPTLTVIAASRVPPRFNLPRLRVVGRPARDRQRRPALPLVGGRAAFPRLLREPAAAGGAGPPRAPNRGLGRRPAAVPSRHPRHVRRTSAGAYWRRSARARA